MRIYLIGLIGFVLASGTATSHGEITGFNNLTGWKYKQGDSGAVSPVGNDFVEITTGGRAQNRNIWFNTPQKVSLFSASFTYRAEQIGAVSARHGVSFVVHNDPDGLDTQATTFNSTGFGFRSIIPSMGVTIELDTGSARTFTGFYRDGAIGGGSADVAPINAFGGDEIDVTIVFDGQLLKLTMDDGVSETFSRQYIVSPSLIDAFASSEAIIGFGATSGPQNGVRQFISDFRFSTVPEPSTTMMLPVAFLGMIMRRSRAV